MERSNNNTCAEAVAVLSMHFQGVGYNVQWGEVDQPLRGVMVLRDGGEKALGTEGLIFQGRQAWYQHVIIIHLAARMVSQPLNSHEERRTQPNLYSALTLSTSDMEH